MGRLTPIDHSHKQHVLFRVVRSYCLVTHCCFIQLALPAGMCLRPVYKQNEFFEIYAPF